VVVKGIATEREEDLVLPACVGGRVGVGHTGDQVLDVQDPGSLKVEVSDHGVGLVEPGSSTPQARRSRRLVGRRADVLKDGGDELPVGGEEALRLGDPASENQLHTAHAPKRGLPREPAPGQRQPRSWLQQEPQ
jgi:hypothetical protein